MKLSAKEFVKKYCEEAGWTEAQFYETQIPFPDSTSPSGWAAVTASPRLIKAHVDLYMGPTEKVPDMNALTSQILFDGHTVLEGEFGFIGHERAYEILRKIHSAMLAAAPPQEV